MQRRSTVNFSMRRLSLKGRVRHYGQIARASLLIFLVHRGGSACVSSVLAVKFEEKRKKKTGMKNEVQGYMSKLCQ